MNSVTFWESIEPFTVCFHSLSILFALSTICNISKQCYCMYGVYVPLLPLGQRLFPLLFDNSPQAHFIYLVS